MVRPAAAPRRRRRRPLGLRAHAIHLATVIVSVLLALALAFSAAGKLRHNPAQMQTMHRVGFPELRVWLLACAELAGAAGLLTGLFWWPLGAAAPIGVVLYLIGAVGSHVRVRDFKDIPAPAVLLVVAGATLVLGSAAA